MPDYIVFRVVDYDGGGFRKTLHPIGRATTPAPGGALSQVLSGKTNVTGQYRVIDEAAIDKFNVIVEPKGSADSSPTPTDEV